MMRYLVVAAAVHLRLSVDSGAGDLAEVDPNSYREVGCFTADKVLKKVMYEGSRPTTPETCFNFCKDQAGMQDPLTKAVNSLQYFAVEGDTSGTRSRACWCASAYQGSSSDGCGPCPKDLHGSADSGDWASGGEACGGAGMASVYLMHHCVVGAEDKAAVEHEEAIKEVAQEHERRKLFHVLKEKRSCSTTHPIKVRGSETMIGSIDECKRACGKEIKCAMFTYDDSISRCLFTDGADDTEEDSKMTCWAKKFGGGRVTVEELRNGGSLGTPDPDLPPEAKEEMKKVAQPFKESLPPGASGPGGMVIDASR